MVNGKIVQKDFFFVLVFVSFAMLKMTHVIKKKKRGKNRGKMSNYIIQNKKNK